MFIYEDKHFDEAQQDDRTKLVAKHPQMGWTPLHYRGLLDDLLPEAITQLKTTVLQGIPTGKLNKHGARMCDYTHVEITAEITEPMTLRQAIPLLREAWKVNTKTLGAMEKDYFVEQAFWTLDSDDNLGLELGLGT